MKKIIITLAITLGTLFTSCTTKEEKINELVDLKHKYELELEIIERTNGISRTVYMEYYQIDEEEYIKEMWNYHLREIIAKDSLEFINIEIQRYTNN